MVPIKRLRASWTVATIGLALLCALSAALVAIAVQSAESRSRRAISAIAHMVELQDAVRSSDPAGVEKHWLELSRMNPDNPSYPEIAGTLAVVKQRFQRILALESELESAPAEGVAGRTPRKILEDLLRERDSAQSWLLEAERSMRIGRNQISESVYENTRYLVILILTMAALVVLAAIQICRYRSDLEIRKQSEEALKESETKFRELFKSVMDSMYQTTMDGELLAANPALVKLLGYDSEEELKAAGLVTNIYAEPHKRSEFIRSVVLQGEVRNKEMVLTRKDGTRITVLDNFRAVLDASGIVAYLEGTLIDISDRIAFEQELARARDSAIQASRLKSEFLANMSHEIRTPMNGVIGMTNMLLDTHLSLEQREYAVAVRRSAGFLLEIINDILDFSKIEAGKPQLASIDFSPRVCVEEVLEMLFEMAEERKLEILCHFDDTVPDALRGDPGRLRQVITNLVGNALKFTEQGEVIVRVSAKDSSAPEVLLEFDVSDTGIGITPDQMARIFEPFCQGDGSTTRKYGGTGLGLNISRRIAETMKGSIDVKSEPGVGSTFHFTAMFENRSPGVAWSPPEVLKGLRVLVVEDNHAARRLLVEKVQNWGMHPTECADGQAALGILQQHSSAGQPIDFTLVDCQMPGLNGIDFVQSVRADDSLTGLQLVLITNFGHRSVALGDWDRTIAGVITKPIRGKTLLDILTHRSNPAPIASDLFPAPGILGRGVSNFRILVAEDNLVNQKVASRMIEKLGHPVDVVVNGNEALLAIEQKVYSLVLMDCQMPGMDGFEATAEIRRRENGTSRLPVIAMTAHAMKGDRERCINAGMDDYLTKPVDAEELAAVLQLWLPKDAFWTEAT